MKSILFLMLILNCVLAVIEFSLFKTTGSLINLAGCGLNIFCIGFVIGKLDLM